MWNSFLERERRATEGGRQGESLLSKCFISIRAGYLQAVDRGRAQKKAAETAALPVPVARSMAFEFPGAPARATVRFKERDEVLRGDALLEREAQCFDPISGINSSFWLHYLDHSD